MTNEEAAHIVDVAFGVPQAVRRIGEDKTYHEDEIREAKDMAIKALEQDPIDKSAMMYDIYMEGVNMAGEYQGCWVRFKDIEKIVDKYTRSEET